MKRLLLSFMFIAVAVCSTTGQSRQEEASQLRTSITVLENRLKEIDLAINKACYEIYIRQMEEANRTIPVFGYKGFNSEKLYETVPHLGELHRETLKFDTPLKDLLNKDRRYRRARRASQRAYSTEKRDIASRKISAVYSRLSVESPEYVDIRKRSSEALRVQNVAILQYLLADYQSRDLILPTKPIISDDELVEIRNNYPEIRRMQNERNIVNNLLSPQIRKLLTLEYGEVVQERE